MAVEIAYLEKRYQLAIKICDAWERADNVKYLQLSGYLLRAASHLNLGEVEEAKRIVQDVGNQSHAEQMLLEAIGRGDTTYQYKTAWEGIRHYIRVFAEFDE